MTPFTHHKALWLFRVKGLPQHFRLFRGAGLGLGGLGSEGLGFRRRALLATLRRFRRRTVPRPRACRSLWSSVDTCLPQPQGLLGHVSGCEGVFRVYPDRGGLGSLVNSPRFRVSEL